MKRPKRLYLYDIQSPSYLYLDDVYSDYFQPSPLFQRDWYPAQANDSQKITSQTGQAVKYEDLVSIVSPVRQGHFQQSKRTVQDGACYAEQHHGSPIVIRPSHFLSPLNIIIPPRGLECFWDWAHSEWRVIDFGNAWDLNDKQMSESGHVLKPSRHISAHPLPVVPSTPKRCFVSSELLSNTEDIHPTLEFAIMYSEPSPLLSSFSTTNTFPDEGSQLRRRILVQVLGATISEDTALDRVGTFTRVSIADKEFMTPILNDTQSQRNARFQFDSVRDTDPFEISVWNDMGPCAEPSLQGSFVATVRRILLMQALSETLTITLDRWPGEMGVMEYRIADTVTIRVQDITQYA